jgi:hypothetical protein
VSGFSQGQKALTDPPPNPRPKTQEQENFGEFADGYAARKLPKPLLVKAVSPVLGNVDGNQGA